jgi:purine-binding chemotaxis protein CheW
LNSENQEKFSRYSVFSLSGQLFGLEINIVREVFTFTRVTKLPNASPGILGVYNLRGSIITLIDLHRVLGLDSVESKDSDTVILIESGKFMLSFIVEKVLDFVEVENSKVQLPTRSIPGRIAHFIRGIYDSENLGQILLVETEKLLKSDEIFSLETR